MKGEVEKSDFLETRSIPILVVDVISANLRALENVLVEPAYKLIRATSAQEALKFMGQYAFAVVVLNLRVSGIDGFELAQAIRAQDQTGHRTSIIFLTASQPDDEDVSRCYRLGAVDFLRQPINAEALKSKVEVFVELYENRAEKRSDGYRDLTPIKNERENLQNLFRHTPEMVCIFSGPEHQFEFVNEAHVRALGFNATGMKIRDAQPESIEVLGILDNVYRTGETIEQHEFAVTVTDRRRFFNFTVAARKSEAGEINGVMSLGVEITDQVLVRERLKEAEKQVVDALESTADGFIALAQDYTVLRVNKNQERISGLSREKTLGKNHWDVWPKDTIPKIWDVYHTVIRDRTPVSVVEFNSYLNVWLAVDAYPTPDGGIAAFFRDITKQRQLENELRESEEKFRLVANSIPQFVWTAKADGYIDWYNDRWYEYTGTTENEMQGWGWQSVHDQKMLPYVLENWKLAIENQARFDMEFPIKGKDGAFRWFLTRVIPITDFSGKVLRWFGTNTDVHEQRGLREELGRSLKIRDEFMSIASHELRTPVFSLKLQVQILARQIAKGMPEAFSPENIKTFADTCNRQISSLVRLIDDMLDVSRIASGRLTMQLAVCDLAKIVDDAVESLRHQYHTAGVQISYAANEDATINGDVERLNQVVSNLLTNALKYGSSKPVHVSVRRDGENALLEVSDNGIGILAENTQRIFERFERGVSSNNISGLGLGLYISRQIVEAHKGTINVQSTEGRGSTFVVQIPLFMVNI